MLDLHSFYQCLRELDFFFLYFSYRESKFCDSFEIETYQKKNGMWKTLNVGTFYLPLPVTLSLCFKSCTSWSSALSHFPPKWKKKKTSIFLFIRKEFQIIAQKSSRWRNSCAKWVLEVWGYSEGIFMITTSLCVYMLINKTFILV